MFRNLNLKRNTSNFTLKKNRYEDLCAIPNEYVESVTFDTESYSQIDLSIPNKTTVNGKEVEVALYDMIKGRMYIVMDLNGTVMQFIIDEDISIEDNGTHKIKQLVGYSREKQLEKKSFIISKGLTRQLYRRPTENVEISDGVLNLMEQQTTWRVGHVDETAMKDVGWYNRWDDFSLSPVSANSVPVGTVVFNIATPELNIPNKPISFTIQYYNAKIYQIINDVEQVASTQTFEHEFKNLHLGVTNIKATFTSTTTHRYGITYTLTFSDGTTEDHEYQFVACKDLKLTIDSIVVKYDTCSLEQTTITKYRFFEQKSTYWYTFLMNDVAEAFDCIFIFDSYNMIVNVYDKNTFGEFKGLYLNYDNGIEQINKTYRIGDVVSRLYVESANTSIISENPLGTTYLENFGYYRNNGIMSDSLMNALDRYDALIAKKHETFLTLRVQKNSVDQALTLAESELLSLQEKYKAANALLTAYVKANSGVKADGTPKDPTPQQIAAANNVESLDGQITAKLKEIDGLKTQQNALQDRLNSIGTDINQANAKDSQGLIFTQNDLDELDDYIVEGSVTDDVYTTAYGLYSHYVKKLQDMNDVYIDFDINTKEFLHKIKHPLGWNHVISLGCKIALDDKDIVDNDGFVRLYGFTYNPKTQQIENLKFTNNKEPMSDIKSIGDIGRTTTQTAYMTDFWKDTWKNAANNNTHVAKLIQDGLDVAAQVVRGKGTVNKIDISESGIYVIDATEDGANDDKQVYIGSGLIAITTDRWKNAKLAIDANGVIANTLIGKVILGEQLFIGNGNNTLKIEPEGLYVYDNTASHTLRVFIGIDQTDNMAKMALYSADGKNNLVLSEKGIYNCYQISDRDSFDYTNPFTAYFYIPENFNIANAFDARLIASIDEFRAYSKTAASMTIDLKSTESSTTTSKTSGDSIDIKFNLNGGTGTALGATQSVSATSNQINQSYQTDAPEGMDSGGEFFAYHKHFYNPTHNHTITITTAPHSHDVKLQGTLNAGKHSHSYEIPGHSHTIKMPSHQHNLVYGIYEHSTIPSVTIYIDSTPVVTLNSGNRSYNGEITNVFRTLNPGTHSIRFVTSDGNGLARGQFTLYWSGFFNYD